MLTIASRPREILLIFEQFLQTYHASYLHAFICEREDVFGMFWSTSSLEENPFLRNEDFSQKIRIIQSN